MAQIHNSARRPAISRSVLATFLLSLLAAGCAVLTVDVDVYKGPLANSEDVQAQQAISLVMGAKPLLVQLRDLLEVSSLPKNPWTSRNPAGVTTSSDVEAHLANFRANSFYRAGEMLTPVQGGTPQSEQASNLCYNFHNDFAIRVNEILGLYEDALPQEITGSVSRGLEVVDEYTTNHATLRLSDTNRLFEEWNEISNSIHVNDSDKYLNALATGYRDFWITNGANIKFQTGVFLTNKAGAVTIDANDTNNGANWLFTQLISSKAANDGRRLFTDASQHFNEKNYAIFTNHVIRVSEAFLKSRANLWELMTLSLRIITDAGPTADLDPWMPPRIRMAASRVFQRLIDPGTLAEFFNDHPWLTNTANLNEKITFGASDNLVATNGPMLKRLVEVLKQCGESLTNDSGYVFSSDFRNNRSARNIVALRIADELAVETDDTMSRSLLVVSQLLKQDSIPRHEFGLATGPIGDASEIVPLDVRNGIETFRRTVGGSLGGGRPARGLESLINNFDHEPAARRTPDSWQDNEAFQNLLLSLTDFGQKITTLANDAVFLESENDSDVQKYVRTLQSVGNSVIVQVNELKSQSVYIRDNHTNAVRTARAFYEAGFTNRTLQEWANSSTSNTPPFTSTDVAAEVLNLLRAEYIQAAHVRAFETAKPDVNSETNAKVHIEQKLKSATNLVVGLWLLADGTVTNAFLADIAADTPAVPPARATNATISLDANGAPQAVLQSSDLAKPEAKPVPMTPGTNLIITIDASNKGVITNLLAGLDTNATQSPGPTNFSISLTVTAEGLLTNIIITTNSANFPKLSKGLGLGLHIAINGGLIASNAPPATNQVTGGDDMLMKAIERATYFRAGMLYLRPTSSYLRSSYPASSVNADQGQIWQNMLQQQFWRSMPIIGGPLTGNNSEAKILSEIDKQSWQNINRIRVAGMYKVNYVIVKDDIGNWYVKGFSTDPTNVFDSMSHLAMFAAGGSLAGAAAAPAATALKATGATNLTGSTSNLTSSTPSPPTTVVSNNILNAEFALATMDYFNSASNAFRALTNDLTNLTNSVLFRSSATNIFAVYWPNNYQPVFNSLTNGSVVLAAAGTNASASAYESAIADVLDSLSQCARNTVFTVTNDYVLSAGSFDSKSPNPGNLTNLTRFTNEITTEVSAYITRTIDAREREVDRYRSALDLINNSAQSQSQAHK